MNMKRAIDSAWSFLSPHFPESGELLNHAKQVGANAMSDTTPVMVAIEKFLATRGKGGILENNLIWNSCKGKAPNDLLPHLKKCGMQSGKMDMVMKILTGGGNNQPPPTQQLMPKH